MFSKKTIKGELIFIRRAANTFKRNGVRINLHEIGDNLRSHALVEFTHVFIEKNSIFTAVILKQLEAEDQSLQILTSCKSTGPIPDHLIILPYSISEAPVTQNFKMNLKIIEADALAQKAEVSKMRFAEKFLEIMTDLICVEKSKERVKCF